MYLNMERKKMEEKEAGSGERKANEGKYNSQPF
jgi:hypothetical protein